MRRSRLGRNFSIATAVVIAVIVYGSLYPFVFRQPPYGLGPARALLDSWRETPSRGDFIANMLFYMPLGFFTILAIGDRIAGLPRIALAVVTGTVLSTLMELAQYYDDGRVASATDLYANVAGTALGAFGGNLTDRNFRWPLLREIAANRIPALLLSAWIGYSLFPFVPTVDLQKYWNALKPVIFHPALTGYGLLRHIAIWLAIGSLIEGIVGPKRGGLLFPLFVAVVLLAKVLMVHTTLTMAEIVGAGLAVGGWGVLALGGHLRNIVIALIFSGYVIAERLEPFQFGATAGSFSWVPFLGFMSSSFEVAVLSFLQKFFFFGSSIWLVAKAGLRLRSSIIVIAVILFTTSYADAYLPNRTAEITDTAMALLIGALFALSETKARRNDASVKEPQQDQHLAASGHEPPDEPIGGSTTVGPARVNDGENGLASWASPDAAFRVSNHSRWKRLAGLVVAAICLALAAAIVVNYPLAPWAFGITLLLYALALWRWPALWLAVIPAVLPSFDLTPWTGWTQVGEPDLVVLVTIGVLALRRPPRLADFRLEGLAAVVLVFSLISYLSSVALGLALPGPEGGSDNPYLRPDNALRLAKGFFTALALLPFLRARMRTHGDALAWLGIGMATGLALVALAVLAERAVFTSPFDFTTNYRVVGTFSSMNIGGGHIGAYIAMALPFLLVCLLRPRPFRLFGMFSTAIGAGYALVVSYARTAYAAALISTLSAGVGWAWAARHRNSGTTSAVALSALGLLTIGGILVAAIRSDFMVERLRTVVSDLGVREENWSSGLALRGDSRASVLFGKGLGTYPRTVLASKPEDRFPTNFVVGQDGGYRFLSLHAGLPTYFGQKVPVQPNQQYRLFLALRSPDGKGVLTVILCEKMLLYSANCRDTRFRIHIPGKWEDFGAVISSGGLDEDTRLGWLKRPVELSLFDPVPGSTIEIGHIRMLDPGGHDILANGDFSRGTERWYFTDDQHLIWRIKNQYLMSFFEGGVLGLASLMLLAGTALAGAVRAIGRGNRMAAPVAASLLAFLCSGVFDYLLEGPRLAALFYIIVFCGLTMMQAPELGPAVSAISRDRSASRSDRPAIPG
jgi:VanZ family protein